MSTASAQEPRTAHVLKFDLPSLLSAQGEVSINGEFAWPISPHALATLYRASAEHCRAIHVKAESAFGAGLEGTRAAELDALSDQGFAQLAVSLAIDWETYGNAFLQVVHSRDKQRILALRRLPARTMCRFRKGFLQRITLPDGRAKKTTFTADEIIQVRDPCPLGSRYALPSWIGAGDMLELAKAATAYNRAFFDNNAMPEYFFNFVGKTPTKEEEQAIVDFFRGQFQGIDQSHRTLIMHSSEGQEIKIEKLTSDMKDADFLKLLDAARDRIPIAHGVPPRMLGIMSAGQLGGGGEVTGQLFTFEHLTLKPKRRRLLDHLRPVLKAFGLMPGSIEQGLAENEVAFRPLDLTPPKDEAEDLPDLVGAGILSAEEARAVLPILQGSHAGANKPLTEGLEKSGILPQADRLLALLEAL